MRKVRETAATHRLHDADLCERIRTLEKEVEELKRQPQHCHHWHPQWTWTTPYYGTITTSSGINTSSTWLTGSHEMTVND